ncbi:MAG: deoxyribose-phosphate aldolase [Oscillospiraceae bacterium]
MTNTELARKTDHTILKANATYEEIKQTIAYAAEIGAASVCLNPAYVALAAEMLRGTSTLVCTVIGFPLGANSTLTKAQEARAAYRYGARELDMVINISALKSGNLAYVKKDIEAVVNATPALVKVILENCYLTKEEIATACRLAAEAGADYVKTSTGFGPSGARAEDVALMKASVPAGIKVKAAGGIGTLADVKAMLAAGADRVGMSRTAGVLAELAAENAAEKAKPASGAKAPAKPAAKPKAAAKKAPAKRAAKAPAAAKKPAKKTTKTPE